MPPLAPGITSGAEACWPPREKFSENNLKEEVLSQSHKDTKMDENDIGKNVVDMLNFGEALMKDGITRTINGQL